jgi:hypothetical protein
MNPTDSMSTLRERCKVSSNICIPHTQIGSEEMWADKVDNNNERCRGKTTRQTTTMRAIMEEEETRWTMTIMLILVRVSI